MKPEGKPKPVNNIAGLSSYMWRFIAPRPENRCIIPLTAYAKVEGEKGAKTRTWFGLKDRPLIAWAGMWKDSDEWGAVFSGLMTGCNGFVAPVHLRMPVLLPEEETIGACVLARRLANILGTMLPARVDDDSKNGIASG